MVVVSVMEVGFREFPVVVRVTPPDQVNPFGVVTVINAGTGDCMPNRASAPSVTRMIVPSGNVVVVLPVYARVVISRRPASLVSVLVSEPSLNRCRRSDLVRFIAVVVEMVKSSLVPVRN